MYTTAFAATTCPNTSSRKPLKEGKILVFLKPCDTYSFNQLLTEHRIDREKVYVVGIPCEGKTSGEMLKSKGISGITGISEDGDNFIVDTVYGQTTIAKADALEERCKTCKSKKHVAYDELIGEDGEVLDSHRFDMVAKLEAMTPDERFAFWRGQLSKCIRCNACRNVCPACTCEQCVFDNPKSGIAQKAAADSFEENMFHIIRAFHVARPLYRLRRMLACYARRTSRFTCSTVNLSRISTNCMVTTRLALRSEPALP